ncbi:MAG: zinc ABC transporter substrate-binding protein [Eubacteriales bacterium]|nr:zinc ABC transporter substrate-binding protein [Eubacteriales bacterium]
MKKSVLFIVVAILIICVSACGAPQTDKLTVAVGIVPEAAFVEKVAGDLVDVVTLIPAGNSPANYAPSAAEMQALSDAAVYFTLQMPTEEANILPNVGDFNDDIIIVNLRDAVAGAYVLLESEHSHDGESGDSDDGESVDPHVWLSPKRAIVMVQTIADTLSAIDAENSGDYQQNAARYIADLTALDSEIQEAVSSLDNKSFLICHAAYGYFADDYGLNMVSIETEGKQATAAEIQQVIDFARGNGITTVFYQEEFDDSQAQTIAEEISGSVVKVAPLAYDYIQGLKEFVNALGGE